MLEYPPDFYSTDTYQSISYAFPHHEIMMLSSDRLKELFYRKNYIIPKYILHSNPTFSGSPETIINILKSNDNFTILGCTFMRFKGLIEYLVKGKFEDTVKFIKHEFRGNINPKLQNAVKKYVDDVYLEFISTFPHYVLNVIQNIIIHIIRYVSIHYEFPYWFNLNSIISPIYEIVMLSGKICSDRVPGDIELAWVYYFARVIPVLEEIHGQIEVYQESNVIEKW